LRNKRFIQYKNLYQLHKDKNSNAEMSTAFTVIDTALSTASSVAAVVTEAVEETDVVSALESLALEEVVDDAVVALVLEEE
jgi:hypothetical protein